MEQEVRKEIYREVERTAKYAWIRTIWKIFMEEPWLERLSDEKYRQYAMDAMECAGQVRWENYESTNARVEGAIRKLLIRYDVPHEEWAVSIWRVKNKFFLSRIKKFERIAAREKGLSNVILPGEKDLDNCEMARIFAFLPAQRDIARYLIDLSVVYNYDHLHMITWFSSQITLGNGKYSRRHANRSARRTYNSLLNPYSLLWIAAALREDPEKVKAAAREMKDYKSFSAKCGAVRRVIPFDRIYELALRMKEWEIRNTGYIDIVGVLS